MASICTSTRFPAHFGQWLEVARRGRKARQWQVAAGLIYGQVKKATDDAGLMRVTHVMRLGTSATLKVARPRIGLLGEAEHRFYRAGSADRPSWGGSAGTSHLGHSPANSTTLSPLGMVASLLSFCASTRIAPGSARSATSARWQTSGSTLPTAYGSSGSGENQPTMDSAGSALLSPAAGTTLHTLSMNEVWRHP
jgi:hypothetical protein